MLEALVHIIVGGVEPLAAGEQMSIQEPVPTIAARPIHNSRKEGHRVSAPPYLGSADVLAPTSLTSLLAMRPKPRVVESHQVDGGLQGRILNEQGSIAVAAYPEGQVAFMAQGLHNGLLGLDAQQVLLLLDALNHLGYCASEGPGALLGRFVARAKKGNI